MAHPISSPLDLPLELFQLCLVEAIKARPVKRALRLRLVNNFFASQTISVIQDFRILDTCAIPIGLLGSLGIDYLTHRLLYTLHPITPRWANMRNIAHRLALEDHNDEASYADYVKLLVHRAVTYGTVANFPICSICQPSSSILSNDPWTEEACTIDLISAAAYTSKLSLIAELSSDFDAIKQRKSTTFGSPLLNAGLATHEEALNLLLQLRKTYLGIYTNEDITDIPTLSRAGVPWPLLQNLLPNTTPENFLTPRNSHKRSDAYAIVQDSLVTPNLTTFNALAEFDKVMPKPGCLYGYCKVKFLAEACREGWVEMVRQVVGMGAKLDGDFMAYRTREGRPLVAACRGGYADVVRVLMESGAVIKGDEVGEAARKGRWEIVRLLLDEYGADINQGATPPIISAVTHERKDVFCELLERGATLEDEIGVKAVNAARKEGLESMMVLLGESGVLLGDTPERQPEVEQGVSGPWRTEDDSFDLTQVHLSPP